MRISDWSSDVCSSDLQPCFAEHVRFDLICSSLAFQWFDDLHASVARLARWLAPGGYLAFTTMADGSFAEWRVACLACDQRAASPDYPSVTALAAVAPPRSEEHTSELQSLMRISYAVFCLKKKKNSTSYTN